MSYEMEYLISLTRCGACGETPQAPAKAVNWEKLLRLAYEQDVPYTAFLPVKKYGLGCPQALVAKTAAQLRGKAVENTVIADGILSLLERAEQEGIRLLVVKGYDAARFYKNPECRVSSDTDLLVEPANEQKALAFLRREGFEAEPRGDSNHTVCYHPTLGVLEMHISLISKRFGTTIFSACKIDDTAFDAPCCVAFAGKSFYALESTNALLFLTFHLIKHFLFNGVSLKMLFDNALFAVSCKENIDKALYRETLAQSDYLYFMQVVFGVMMRYAGFNAADFPIEPLCNEADMTVFLEHMEADGAMGKKNEAATQEAWMFYNYRFAKESGNAYDMALVKKETRRDVGSAVFPSKNVLARRYPVLLRHAWLYPFCWLHRLFTRGFRFLFSDKKVSKRKVHDEAALSPEAKKRIDLFKQFEIM